MFLLFLSWLNLSLQHLSRQHNIYKRSYSMSLRVFANIISLWPLWVEERTQSIALSTPQEDICHFTFSQPPSFFFFSPLLLVVKRSSCRAAFPWGQLKATPRDSDVHTKQDKVTAPFLPLCLCCTLSCYSEAFFFVMCTLLLCLTVIPLFFHLVISIFLLLFSQFFFFVIYSFSYVSISLQFFHPIRLYHHHHPLCHCLIASFPCPAIDLNLSSMCLTLTLSKRAVKFPTV